MYYCVTCTEKEHADVLIPAIKRIYEVDCFIEKHESMDGMVFVACHVDSDRQIHYELGAFARGYKYRIRIEQLAKQPLQPLPTEQP